MKITYTGRTGQTNKKTKSNIQQRNGKDTLNTVFSLFSKSKNNKLNLYIGCFVFISITLTLLFLIQNIATYTNTSTASEQKPRIITNFENKAKKVEIVVTQKD